MSIRVSKLHATGNDFLVVYERDPTHDHDETLAARARILCDRHRGIGADGLISLWPGSNGADCTMVVHNADGSLAEMTGNGIRCLAWVAVKNGYGDGETLVVDTSVGRRNVELAMRRNSKDLEFATVDMGPVTFEPKEIPLDAESAFDLEATYHGTEYHGDAAGVGNPHLVLLVNDVEGARVVQHGPHLEHDERFPKRTNVEFINVVSERLIEMRVWERGVGETLSCGTGACAAAAVAHRRGLVATTVDVRVPGGVLQVELGETARLGGPVRHVFDVDVDAAALLRGDE